MGGKCVVISNTNDKIVDVKIVCSALNEINHGFVRTYLACVCVLISLACAHPTRAGLHRNLHVALV